ncbi:leucine-rich repeat flightless-interacting protein 2 isoform X2 [Callorhinchus milii]|uniref:leucine-rich repeat flightless-interacting protein 2 isoform X2 n=1 Tax=Callorhinchus milii TaxID=7868 RepID=UPI001C3FA52C|nr:leucine-rich repeat flightless-interacting protein 2 isoform X2 [Callorhinchus milii]
MGTPGAGRKRTPIKDRFSAEDEALSHIAREAEARLAAKRAARAEARDIRMKELERQQKEFHRPSGSKWGEIHQWMENTERAKHSHKSGRYHLHTSSDLGGSYRSSSRRKDYVSSDVKDKSSQFKKLSQANSVYSDRLAAKKTLSSSNKDLLSGMYYDQRNYSTLRNSKLHSYSRPSSLYSDPIATTKSYRPSSLYSDPIGTTKSYRPSSLYSDPVATTSYRASSNLGTGLYRSQSLASLRDTGLYHRDPKYSSRTPSEYSYSFRSSSARSSPLNSDDETLSTVSQDGLSRGRRDSVSSDFSDQSESIADYFSRSNRRGSVVSDLDDSTVPDLFILEEKTESFSRPASRNAVAGLSPATLASLGGSSSRRGSGDSSSVLDPDVSLSELRDIYDLKDQIQDVEGRYMQGLKELKDSLSEVEEKYKKAMVSNAQLDNEKSNLIYQVDTLKDVIEELEEQMSELYRENVEKSKELERQKHMCIVSQHKAEELKEGIRQRDELIEENKCMQQRVDTLTREVFDLQETVIWKDKKIGALERQKDYFDCIKNERDELRDELAELREKSKKHGLVIIPEGTPNGDINHEPIVGAITVVSQEAAQVLEGAGDGPLDVRLKKLAEEKEELLGQIRKLKFQVEEERQKNSKIENVLTDSDRLENGTDLQILEMQRDINRQLSEYKFKLSKAEQDNATLEQNVSRLEGQVLRYKSSAENSEKIEDELKAEKRRLQRELRSAMDKTEEMEMTNSHLVKRLEKMKANRNALLSQQ